MEQPQSSARVTALVVSRNDEAALRRCLEHLEASTNRERLEVLVVDDGSHDGSADAPAEFPDVVSLRVPKRVGFTRAANIGLRTAKGDLILLLPQDVLVRPETVTQLADRLEAGEDIGAVTPWTPQTWQFPTPADLAVAWRSGALPHPQDVAPNSGDVSTDYPRFAPMMMRRGLLRATNWFDQRFGAFWSDLELCARIRGGGKKILILTDVSVNRSEVLPPVPDTLEWTDSANGIRTYIGLHYSFGAALQFQIAASLHALGRGRISAVTGILSGAKIDGNQD